jgi:hypothetical protein
MRFEMIWGCLALALSAACGQGETAPRAALLEPCCVPEVPDCAGTPIGQCAEGLTCFVLPYGMYTVEGICCDGTDCRVPCDLAACVQAWCAPGEAGCPELLTCRHVDYMGDFCLP